MLELFGFLCCMYLLYKYVERDQDSDNSSPRTKPSRKSTHTSKR